MGGNTALDPSCASAATCGGGGPSRSGERHILLPLGVGEVQPDRCTKSVADLPRLVIRKRLAVAVPDMTTDGKPAFITRPVHTSGQWIEATIELLLSQETPRAWGYARNYGFCSLLTSFTPTGRPRQETAMGT